jgi:predicted nucleic acid-binding protein
LTALVDTSVLVGSVLPPLDEPWVVSIVTVGELQAGVLLADEAAVRSQRLRRLTAVLVEAPVVPIEQAVAARYGELRAATGRQPSNDLWIAATALAHDLTLVTSDERLASLRVRAKMVGEG